MIKETIAQWEFNRGRTLGTLNAIEEMSNAKDVLAWRPGEGRAHIAWQLMHIGITEELFATERLSDASPTWPELVPRFKGGSTPDDNVPDFDLIKTVLDESRSRLTQLVSTFQNDDLETIPESMKERGWTIATVLKVLSWHECHHQGQAHITLNLWKNRQTRHNPPRPPF